MYSDITLTLLDLEKMIWGWEVVAGWTRLEIYRARMDLHGCTSISLA